MLDIIKKIRRIIPPKYKVLAIFLIIMMGLSAVFELCMLGLLMPLVLAVSTTDWTRSHSFLEKLYHICGNPSGSVFIMYLAAGLIALAFLKAGFNYLMICSQSLFVANLTRVLTRNLDTNYVAAPYLFHVIN